MVVNKILKRNYYVNWIYYFLRFKVIAMVFGDKKITEKKFYKNMGYKPNLKNPKTVNEKIQWIKLNDRKDFHTLVADKYRVREYYKEISGSEEHIVPLIKKYDSWKDIELENLPDEPFIIKANTGSGTWQIVRDKKNLDIKKLRNNCRLWMNLNHYYRSQEWQYKNIKPCIIVEKLLIDKNGKVPFDYKLHYINGELQFIYCVVDREGNSYRAMFSPEWKLLPFQWVSIKNHKPLRTNVNEPRPVSLDEMIKYGNIIAKQFKNYVRVDFYELDGKFYFGEVTLHHGSGYNKFYPPEAEKEYADKMVLDI